MRRRWGLLVGVHPHPRATCLRPNVLPCRTYVSVVAGKRTASHALAISHARHIKAHGADWMPAVGEEVVTYWRSGYFDKATRVTGVAVVQVGDGTESAVVATAVTPPTIAGPLVPGMWSAPGTVFIRVTDRAVSGGDSKRKPQSEASVHHRVGGVTTDVPAFTGENAAMAALDDVDEAAGFVERWVPLRAPRVPLFRVLPSASVMDGSSRPSSAAASAGVSPSTAAAPLAAAVPTSTKATPSTDADTRTVPADTIPVDASAAAPPSAAPSCLPPAASGPTTVDVPAAFAITECAPTPEQSALPSTADAAASAGASIVSPSTAAALPAPITVAAAAAAVAAPAVHAAAAATDGVDGAASTALPSQQQQQQQSAAPASFSSSSSSTGTTGKRKAAAISADGHTATAAAQPRPAPPAKRQKLRADHDAGAASHAATTPAPTAAHASGAGAASAAVGTLAGRRSRRGGGMDDLICIL